jgi:DNA-binding transcriptional LysR family regulator
MVSERLLDQLRQGHLHAAVIHQVPALATMETLAWEPLRRGRLAVLASPSSKLALREAVTLSELSGETFLVNPRSLRRPSRVSSLCAANSEGSTQWSWNPPPPRQLPLTPTGAPFAMASPSR